MLDKFEPTKQKVLNAMVALAKIKPNIKHIDLGSGDGQIVNAFKSLGANSWGIEIDPILAEQSRIQYGITVLNEDCFNSDVSQADVITCWFSLLPGTDLLLEKLKSEMKRGSILIKQTYTPSSWEPIDIQGNFTKELFQGKNIFRIDGEIISIYKK